jgi:hypothetical protein
MRSRLDANHGTIGRFHATWLAIEAFGLVRPLYHAVENPLAATAAAARRRLAVSVGEQAETDN